jgi:AcrR family transcriptional regulator
MARLSKKKVEKAIIRHLGNMSKIAEACGVSRSYIYKYIKKKGMWDLVEESREMLIDNVEDKAYSVAMKGNPTLLQFLLKTRGKQRGYVEKTETDNTGKQEIIVRYDRSQPVPVVQESAGDQETPGEV